MNFCMYFFTIIIAVLLLLVLIYALITWCESPRNNPKIKFKSFVKFYDVNPNRWNLYDEYIECRIDDKSWNYSVERFSFGFIDFWRYKLWHKMQKRAERNKQHAESTSRMIAAVRRDIDKQNETAKHKQDEALANFLGVFQNCYSTEERLKLEELLRKVKNL